MGSLTSRPKAPKIKTIVVQSPAQTAVTPVTPTTPAEPDPETVAAQARTRDLLTRKRGFLGTIGTGFRGLLGALGNNVNRKTLLGE
ncbi:MAG: hypothetical protein KA099_02970 [Alphaproteobacteria bacterium]|jgi:hypothetical protein|nr:hypothetical protein [Alphaproteobacteria bacterium]MBK9584418.1 hypothetical protein [Alphaproteobacteria bacterium]MBP7759304.1 hypothetical protein [Alphaproteobacteria bacterium]MBP7762517.1 hypothetical protein [Alphaproteobacteria bacterium]MBP7904264.1 hypothetical protein [Alphaproteobacteria bacterium]